MKRLADCKGIRDMLEPGDVLTLTRETPLMFEMNPRGLTHVFAAITEMDCLPAGTRIKVMRKRHRPLGPWVLFQRCPRVPWYYVREMGGRLAGWVCGAALVGQIPLA